MVLWLGRRISSMVVGVCAIVGRWHHAVCAVHVVCKLDAARWVEEGEAWGQVWKRLTELRRSPGVVARTSCLTRRSGRDEQSLAAVADREKARMPWSERFAIWVGRGSWSERLSHGVPKRAALCWQD